MLYEKTLFDEIKELGFDIIPHQRDGVNGMLKIIQVAFIPPLNKILGLLRLLPNDYELSFFDYYHPQISDPGAYCSAVVINQNTVSYMEGNHGWTSKWKETPIEDFAAFIQKNWDKDDGSSQFINCVHIKSNHLGNPR